MRDSRVYLKHGAQSTVAKTQPYKLLVPLSETIPRNNLNLLDLNGLNADAETCQKSLKLPSEAPNIDLESKKLKVLVPITKPVFMKVND